MSACKHCESPCPYQDINSAQLAHIALIRTDHILCFPVLAVFPLVIIFSNSPFSSSSILELIITKSNTSAKHHWKRNVTTFLFAQKLNSANNIMTIFTESQNINYQDVLICSKVYFSFWAKQAQVMLLTSSNDSYFSLPSEHKQMWTDTTKALCYNSSFYNLILENSVLLLFFIMLYRNSNWIWECPFYRVFYHSSLRHPRSLKLKSLMAKRKVYL